MLIREGGTDLLARDARVIDGSSRPARGEGEARHEHHGERD
jgi:hypothetical protein